MGTGEDERPGRSLRDSLPAKGIQPRIVLGLLLGGSLAGVWVTHLVDPLATRTLTWLAAVAIGLLAGGLYWRLVLFDRELFDDADDCRSVTARWRRIETVAVWGFALSGLGYLAVVADTSALGVAGIVFGAGVALGPPLWAGSRLSGDDGANRVTTAFRFALLQVALGSLVALARLEAGPTALDWGVRVGHLGAFSLWLGGAVWHNFVILPTVRSRPGATAALKAQARRFRRHLPIVIPLLLATGAYQTDRLVGLSLSAFSTRIGHFVGVKLFVLAGLTALVIVNYRKSES